MVRHFLELSDAGSDGLAAILWQDDDPDRVRLGEIVEDVAHPVLVETERQLDEYFLGDRETFDLPLDFHGTSFQKRVWAQLLEELKARGIQVE